jgi:SAM-dependent methyltransferase
MSDQNSQPSPMLFFDTVNAHVRTEALKAAVDLGLFTAIGEGATTAAALAEKCGAAERGVRILCDYLTVIGFLTKQGTEYGLTQDTAVFLDKRSPAYLGGTLEFLLSSGLMRGYGDLAAAVRKGGTASQEGGTVSPENPVWVKFARAMVPMMMMPAQAMAERVALPVDRPVKILDVAAGHGIFGIAFAQRYPNVTVVAQDWGSVLEVAAENAQKFGVADRHSLLPGSAFDVDFGNGYDLVLVTNFLHHFDAPTNTVLMKKVHAALADGGRAATLEFVPNPDRITPPWSAGFALTMLVGTPAGDAYTFEELDAICKDAGFVRNECESLAPSMNHLVVSYK